MSIRLAARQVAVSCAALAAMGAFSVAMLSGPAGAAAPTNGSTVPNAAQPVGSFTPGTPFSSGQGIDVVVPANSLFVSTTNVNILECSAPNGVVPTSPAACNGDTIQGPSVAPNSDGSIDYQSATGSLYPVYFTPDASLGDTGTSPKCGNTAATECILYIGENQGDFTQPHVWSQPFFVNPTAGDTGANPGDGNLPEVPLAILLPISALGILGGTIAVRRRRSARAESSLV